MNNPILKKLLLEKEQDIRNRLYHYTQVNFSYHSNYIEGSTLSHFQTNEIYEKNNIHFDKDKVIKVDDILEAKNHFKAFDFILESAADIITAKYLKELHKIMKNNCSNISTIGDFKKCENFVGNIVTTPAKLVKKEINILLTNYYKKESHTIEDIIDFHYHFEKIHPFEDGNGRVGRLIMFKECLKNNIVPFIIDEYHRDFYYRGLREYSKMKGYLIDTCLSCQDRYKEVAVQLGVL